jgi:hypothetical protein
MEQENVFDLTQIANKTQRQSLFDQNEIPYIEGAGEIKNHSAEKVKQMLQGYELVDKSKWNTLLPNTQIRYLRTDGNLRGGGFVKFHYQNNNKSIIKMTNANPSFQQSADDAKEWSINITTDVKKIWKKQGTPSQIQQPQMQQPQMQPYQMQQPQMQPYQMQQPQMVIPQIPLDSNQNATIQLMSDRIDALEDHLKSMEQKGARTLELIKKLHNITI